MVDIRHLRHFLAVASHPTVQAAADSLHLTQSALTKSIARFEDELGAPLFDRRGHRLALTELGERLVERGQDVMRHVRQLEEEVELWKGLGAGEVAIGADPEAEFGLLPSVLDAFVPSHPGVQVSLCSGHAETLLPALLRGELHFLVADAEIALDHRDLEIRAFAAAPMAAALRPGHPLARKRKPAPEDIDCYPRIGASTAPRFERWRTERVRREGAEPHTPSLVCDNYEMLAGLAERSDAIVFGPRDILERYEGARRLKVVAWPLEGPESQLSLIRSRGRHLSPAAERLIELVVQEAASRRCAHEG